MNRSEISIQKNENTKSAIQSHAPTSFSTLARSPLEQASSTISNLTKPIIQPKLRIGAPNDKYEQEADRVADQVMRIPEPDGVQTQSSPPHIQRLCPECEDEVQRQAQPEIPKINPVADTITPLVQRQEVPEEEEEEEVQPGYDQKPEESTPILESVPTRDADELGKEEEEEVVQAKSDTGEVPQVTSGIANNIQSHKGSGQPLRTSERAFFEPRFGTDFSHVRIHTDSRAARTAQLINARAFTLGSDIVFGAGQYFPGITSSRRLLAHELTHVVQQDSSITGKADKIFTPTSIPLVQRRRRRRRPSRRARKWTRQPIGKPKLLDKQKADYEIKFNHVLPARPKGVTQVWQVVNCKRLLLGGQCNSDIKNKYTIDIVNVGTRKKIRDIWSYSYSGAPCFLAERCNATIGFNNKKIRYAPQVNINVTKSLANKVLKDMTPPKGRYSGMYTFVKKRNCPRCRKLRRFKKRYRAPEGEVLKISGLGSWKS